MGGYLATLLPKGGQKKIHVIIADWPNSAMATRSDTGKERSILLVLVQEDFTNGMLEKHHIKHRGAAI